MKYSLSLLALMLLSSCSAWVVPKPTAITLENGLRSVGAGLAAMKQELGETKTGLIPTEATVVFAITASGTDKNDLVIGLTPPIVGNGVKIDDTLSNGSTAARSNTITVKFENLAKLTNTGMTVKQMIHDGLITPMAPIMPMVR